MVEQIQNLYYLIALLISLAGLGYADYRHKLAIFRNPKLFGQLLFISVGFFLVWDIAGIVMAVFATNQDWVSGLHIISPDLPVEELFFLTLLSYVTLLSWRLVWQRTS